MARIKDFLTPAMLLVLSCVVAYDHLAPKSAPVTTDAVTLGKKYAPILVKTYSDAWNASANTLESGKTVTEAQKVFQETWQKLRNDALNQNIVPRLSIILPPGTEPATAEKRAEVVAFWRSFAEGLVK